MGAIMKAQLMFTKNFIYIFARILVKTTPIWGVVFLIIFGLAWAFARIEEISFLESLYFSGITALTIGYGDIIPLTKAGKAIALFMGILGVLNTGIIVAVALQAMRVTYDVVIEEAKGCLEQLKKK